MTSSILILLLIFSSNLTQTPSDGEAAGARVQTQKKGSCFHHLQSDEAVTECRVCEGRHVALCAF